MRVAFGSASGVIAAEADDPDTARKKRPAVRRDDLRSTRKFVIWGLAMLLIGLSAGLMLNGIIADQAGGRPVSDVVAVLQLVLFVAAVGVLLYLVADTMGGVSDLAASARATEERLAPPLPILSIPRLIPWLDPRRPSPPRERALPSPMPTRQRTGRRCGSRSPRCERAMPSCCSAWS